MQRRAFRRRSTFFYREGKEIVQGKRLFLRSAGFPAREDIPGAHSFERISRRCISMLRNVARRFNGLPMYLSINSTPEHVSLCRPYLRRLSRDNIDRAGPGPGGGRGKPVERYSGGSVGVSDKIRMGKRTAGTAM